MSAPTAPLPLKLFCFQAQLVQLRQPDSVSTVPLKLFWAFTNESIWVSTNVFGIERYYRALVAWEEIPNFRRFLWTLKPTISLAPTSIVKSLAFQGLGMSDRRCWYLASFRRCTASRCLLLQDMLVRSRQQPSPWTTRWRYLVSMLWHK